METLILIALAGLIWGSFLNVVIYRLPLGLSLAKPPSACPACGARIKPYDNIPVVSYLVLGGKCRACGKPIPFSYVLAEILTPLAFLVLHHHFGLTLHFFASALFTRFMRFSGGTDCGSGTPCSAPWPGPASSCSSTGRTISSGKKKGWGSAT
jgi:leader peptidase (prepilin peptidase)/N-methyltransferase